MRTPHRRRYPPGAPTLALLLLLIAAPLLARADALSIHVIQRADAQALVPVIRPLLPEGGYVNAYQGKLVIRTTSANFDQVLAALGDMPEVPRTVSVHLRRRAPIFLLSRTVFQCRKGLGGNIQKIATLLLKTIKIL